MRVCVCFAGAFPGSEWYIYDVGGARSMVRVCFCVVVHVVEIGH